MTPRTPWPASPWRAWGIVRRAERVPPPSRLLIRRALNDPAIFDALLRELKAHSLYLRAETSERSSRRRAFLALATETDRLSDERRWVRLTPEAEARQRLYVEARRAKLPRLEALLFAAGRLPGSLPAAAGPTSSPALARPTEAPTASERGAA